MLRVIPVLRTFFFYQANYVPFLELAMLYPSVLLNVVERKEGSMSNKESGPYKCEAVVQVNYIRLISK
jgi:hypothetical protein